MSLNLNESAAMRGTFYVRPSLPTQLTAGSEYYVWLIRDTYEKNQGRFHCGVLEGVHRCGTRRRTRPSSPGMLTILNYGTVPVTVTNKANQGQANIGVIFKF